MTKKNTSAVPTAAVKKETKKDRLVGLLSRKDGASIEEMTLATGWLPHTARAMLTGLRKQGLAIERSKVEGVTRYIVRGEAA